MTRTVYCRTNLVFQIGQVPTGSLFAGEIDAVGNDVSTFAVGERVFAQTDFRMGAYAEYRCFAAEPGEEQGMIANMPENLSFEEAASLPLGGLEALKYLREADVQPGETVLIIGSAGSIGTLAMLRRNGRLILANPRMSRMMKGWRTVGGGKRVIVGLKNRSNDLAVLKELTEFGVLRPVVDRSFALEEIRDAHRYVESGSKKGSLVIMA